MPRLAIYFIILLSTISLAFAADWVAVDGKLNWQRTSLGFCARPGQCLVSNSFNELFDNIPNAYRDGLLDPYNGPKCIASGQFIDDNYCKDGNWSSRTYLISRDLLSVAVSSSQSDFSIYCDSYQNVLNTYHYSNQFRVVYSVLGNFCEEKTFGGLILTNNCINNICAVKYGSNVGFGVSLNSNLSDPRFSFLHALNLDESECDNAINDDDDYDYCGDGVWYNWNLNSVLYLPGITSLPPSQLVDSFFEVPYDKIKSYVFANVHNPSIAQFNYSFFNDAPSLSKIFIAKDDSDFVFSFKQENVTLNQIDYAGWYLSNIQLPSDSCTRVFKRYDSRANCEVQPVPDEFYIAAHRTPQSQKSLVSVWPDVSGKVRLK